MLEIKKTGNKNFTHYWVTPSGTFEYLASDLNIIFNNNKVFVPCLFYLLSLPWCLFMPEDCSNRNADVLLEVP